MPSRHFEGYSMWLAGAVVAVSLIAGAPVSAEPATEVTVSPNAHQEDMVGYIRPYATLYEDTLLDLARDNGLGYVEIIAANPGVDPWVPGAGTQVLLPTGHILPDAERKGLVINLAEHRLYYFKDGEDTPITLPLGVGKDGWSTPLGVTKIVRKRAKPIWYPPASIREEHPELPLAVPPGPDNPLGTHALYFDWPSYLVHGTNAPWGIGRRVSHGCIRLYPEDITKLFSMVEVGTVVQVIAQPIKVGWHKGELYLEAHPDPIQADELERDGKISTPSADPLADSFFRIRSQAGQDATRLDWKTIRSVLNERSGIPVRITKPATVRAG